MTKAMTTKIKSYIGKVAPNLQIESSSGESINLKKMTEQNIVLYFYPKDDTPGCTLEGHEFNKLLPEFKKLKYIIYGVSRDTLKSHEKFISKCGYQFDLLSDTDEKLCNYFDVIKEKNMYGKKVFGIERSTFILSEGRVIKEYRKVKAEGHAEFILNDIKSI